MANKKKEEESLEEQLRIKLDNFTPEEAEGYLKVLLRKCLEATIKEDYLVLGNTEELLNKSILILDFKINNFNLFYSNLKLEVATEYLAKYIDVKEVEAFNFLNVVPKFYKEPKETIEEKTAEELLIKIKCYCHYIEDYKYCLETALGNLYVLNLELSAGENRLEGMYNLTLISGFYERLEKAFNEVEKYSDYEDTLGNSILLGSEKENKTNWEILYFIKTTEDIKKEYEEFKLNPFYETALGIGLAEISILFDLKEPIDNIETFKESLTEEKDKLIVNWLFDGFTTNLATYDFKNFEIKLPKKRKLNVNDNDKKILEDFIKSKIKEFKIIPPTILRNLGLNEEDIYNANEKTIRNINFF